MSPPRPLRDHERLLLLALLRSTPEGRKHVDALADLLVREFDDGGMGGLLLLPGGVEAAGRVLGRVLVSAEFDDADGVPVLVVVNLDEQGRLFELDLWKVDFRPLVRWPPPDRIRVAS